MSEQVSVSADKKRASAEQEDLRWILSTMQGRRFMYRFLEMTGIYQSSFHASGSQVYFNEGERNVGLKVLAQINALDDNAYINILKVKKEIENV